MNEKLLSGELEQVRTSLDLVNNQNGPEKAKQLTVLREEIESVSFSLVSAW